MSGEEGIIFEAAIEQFITIIVMGWSDCWPITRKSKVDTCHSSFGLGLNGGQQKVQIKTNLIEGDTVWVKFSNFFSDDDVDLQKTIIDKINDLLPGSNKLKERSKGCNPGTKIFFWIG
jgi:hypothetical protein